MGLASNPNRVEELVVRILVSGEQLHRSLYGQCYRKEGQRYRRPSQYSKNQQAKRGHESFETLGPTHADDRDTSINEIREFLHGFFTVNTGCQNRSFATRKDDVRVYRCLCTRKYK